MPTAPLLTRCHSNHQMSAPWEDPRVNKFEQVSSVGRQMSLAGVPVQRGQRGGRGAGTRARGSLYDEVQYITDNGHMRPPPHGQTHTNENITFQRGSP